MTIREPDQHQKHKQADDKTAGPTDKGAASDKHLWHVWMGLMIIAVALLPFIVREGALVRAIADMCMTALGI